MVGMAMAGGPVVRSYGLLGSRPRRSLFSGGGAGSPVSMGGGGLPDNVFTGLDGKQVALPGPISGYGGGTWNLDGSVATPVDRLGDAPMFEPSGIGASASGFPPMPDAPPTEQPVNEPIVVSRPRGMFGASKRPPAMPTQSAAPESWGVSILPPLPDTAGLPRRGFAEPFDYDAALAKLLPKPKKKNVLRDIASVLGPALMAAGGNQAGANAMIARMHAQRDARDEQRRNAIMAVERWRHDDYGRQQGADLRASNPFTIGRDRLQYDPQTGEVATLYDGPEPFEQYAEELGLEPGTPEYFEAVEDYVLRANGPSAYQRDVDLDDYRTGNRIKVEGVRQGNRLGLEGIRQRNRIGAKASPTYRDTHPRAGSARPTATGPGGQKVEWDGKAWVPVR